jgi:23S rRNA (uracil1939-C5)-methyltransferase
MSRKNKNQPPREPEFATGLHLLDMAYGGESVARLPIATSPGTDDLRFTINRENGAGGSQPQSSDDSERDEAASAETRTSGNPEQTEENHETAIVNPKSKIQNPGEVVFVAGGLPGEVVDVQLYRRKKSFLRGNVTRVVESSSARREAPCPWFGVEKWPNCGGCQWQHADYNAQLGYKAGILRDQLVRIGGFENPPLLEPVPARSAWAYRNNVEFQIDRQTGRPCYHRQNSIRLVPVESCHIAHPLINLAIEPLAEALAKHLNGKVHQVTVRVGSVVGDAPIAAEEITALAPYSQDEAARLGALERFSAVSPLEMSLNPRRPALMFILRMLGPTDLTPFVTDMQAALDRYAELSIIAEGKKRRLDVLCGPNWLEEVLHGVTYRIPPLAFFQSNSPMAEELVSQALEAFEVAGLELRGARLLDIFCGVGTFSLQLAQRGAQVLGIEEYEGATQAAEENARLNQLDKQTSFVAAKAEEYILELEAQGQPYDGVLLDPPRRGCDPALLESLLKTKPPVIVYVSCDPSTLARDLKILGSGYRLVRSRAVDLFPQTYHMESVSLLVRKED